LADTFDKNELTEVDIGDIDHDLLLSMGINIAKTRLKIIKMKNKYLQKESD
jgi:hypothetical protein